MTVVVEELTTIGGEGVTFSQTTSSPPPKTRPVQMHANSTADTRRETSRLNQRHRLAALGQGLPRSLGQLSATRPIPVKKKLLPVFASELPKRRFDGNSIHQLIQLIFVPLSWQNEGTAEKLTRMEGFGQPSK